MNPDKQRAAIAEYCGWKDVRGHMGIPPENGRLFPYPEHHEEDWRLKPFRGIPDYLNDLNAMHEAERQLLIEGDYWGIYCDRLLDIVVKTGGYGYTAADMYVHATAKKRAEAFLKTIGKWEE